MGGNHLPIQLTSFIGRELDLVEIKRSLAMARLVTLTGAGGSGKTRLAIQVTNMVDEVFEDGVWLADLVPLREADLVPALVAQALGLHPVADQPVLESLLIFVRNKHLLLILDNCEHLIEACAQLVEALLCHAPDIQILATSRVPLAIDGETLYPVPGLAWPEMGRGTTRNGQTRSDPQDLFSFEAVSLFIERSRSISPKFNLTSENATAVAEICRRLDGLPLALELASARVNVLTVQEIAARLDHRFALLTSAGKTGLDPRHATLQAAIDWSYGLLRRDEQTVLRRLAVFVAGCSLDTAEAVCTGEGIETRHILDLLSSLVDKSLIVAETTGRAQARYRLLETIREYASEKLVESGEGDRLRNRHLELFLARAEEAAPKMGDAYQRLWLNWLEGENDNLRAALAWALEKDQIEAGLRICIAISRFWEIRGYVPEGMTWFDRLLARADVQVPLVVRANALTYASHMSMFLDDPTTATIYASEAVALAEAAGDQGDPILIFALGGLSSSMEAAGHYQAAFEVGERTLQLLRETPGDSFLLGMSYLGIGNLAVEAGHYNTARELLDEALRMASEAGDTYRIAHTFTTLGKLAFFEGNYGEARTSYEKSVELLRELEARHDLASILRNLGYACLQLGEIERAEAHFWESLVLHQAEQSRTGMVECLIGLGSTAVVRGSPAAGARLLLAAMALRGLRYGHVWPAMPMKVEPYLELAHSRLTETEFKAEQAEGQAMSLEKAIQYAQTVLLKPEVAPVAVEKTGRLTSREREVAALIAQGKSNREIAETLVLSTRTVEKHVANILAKLGLTSRAQIVRWAMEHEQT